VTADRLLERGTLRRVDAIGNVRASSSTGDRRIQGGRRHMDGNMAKPHGRLQGATNLRLPRSRASETAAEQAVEAGRNGKDGTDSETHRQGPKRRSCVA